MPGIAEELRTDAEKRYGNLMIVFGVLIWLVAIVISMGMVILYGLLFALFHLISIAIYRATAFGNMILLGPRQFPELHSIVEAAARDLGMSETPKAFLYNSNGLFNAFARRMFGGQYLFLTSALVDAENDEQVRFVIGHELGHHAAGHLDPWMNLIRLPGNLVPFRGLAYSRAREYTCDRIGAHISKDLAASLSSLQMLGCGCRRLNQTMDSDAFVAQEAMVPPFFGVISEICRTHPRLTRRLAAIANRG
ncbi:MAG: M48 family metallopeptidase [Rhizomicrobium sp.]